MDIEYLEESFDPNTAKVAELRRILTENQVAFSSHAKKVELVQLFDEKVTPKIPKLRKTYENLLPSDKGIVKVSSRRKSKSKTKERKRPKVRKAKVKSEENNDEGTPAVEIIQSSSTQGSAEVSVKAESEEEKDITPFSEVNEFQQASEFKERKGRHRKMDNGEIDENIEVRSDTPITATPSKDEVAAQDLNSTKTRKRRRRIGDGEDTPITKKVAKKSPQKSPHRSLIIDKFESSSSDSSFNSTSMVNVSNAAHAASTPEEGPLNGSDFSYRRRTISPDLSKLNVSAAFAAQLKNAVKESPELTASQLESEQERVSRPHSSIRVSRKNSPVAHSEEITSPIMRSSENDDDHSSSQETIKSTGVERDISVTPEATSTSDREPIAMDISGLSPEQAVQAVQDSESRVEKMQDMLDDVVESNVPLLRGIPRKSLLSTASTFIANLLFFMFVIASVMYGLWYREQKIFVGYCGNEKNLMEYTNYNPIVTLAENFLEAYKPQCVPCPENAICYPFLEIKCRPEYTIQKSHFSLNGLLPFSDYCIKDSKREKLISEVVQKSLEILRAKNAQLSCGECEDELKSGLSEQELYEIFYESRAPWISDEEFDELWVQAISDLENEPEIKLRQVSILLQNNLPSKDSILTDTFLNFTQVSETELASIGNANGTIRAHGVQGEKGYLQKTNEKQKTRYFRSTSKKYISLRCKFEREVYQTYYRLRYILWSATSILIIAKVIDYKLRRYYKEKRKIEQLTQKVISKLKDAKNENKGPESITFLSTVQLRDVFLADITDLGYKNVLWQKVVKRLEHNNTNIKSSLMEIHGEIMKCWEWIGPH